MLNILSRALGSQFEIVTLDDPMAALSLLENGAQFSVVISDMKMPQMDGADFLARVKTLTPGSTRLALTGCLERQLPPDQVFGMLTKPCPLNLLRESVAAAVQHHTLLADLASASATLAPNDLDANPTLLPDSSRAGRSEVRLQCPDPGSGIHPAVAGRATALPRVAHVDRRMCLRLLGRDEPLGTRATLLGRARTCDIVINDARLSLRHARFFNSWRGMTVQDVSGTDGVRVNQQRFVGVREIQVGDWLSLGPLEVQVRSLPEQDRPVERRPAPAGHERGAKPEDLPRGASVNTFAILATVAAKFFLLRQGQEAERILRPPLEDLLARCERGACPASKDTELAVKLAVRLADETRDARWLDYVFRIFSALRRPLPASISEQLHVLVRQLPGTSLAGFRAYASVLRSSYAQFTPAEQFLVRRVEGLEALLLR